MDRPNLNTFSPTPSVIGETSPLPVITRSQRVCVVGAGAFGGWTALHLLRQGFNVTLIDAWGAGNSRSSSGDETRVIRSTYGANELYFQMNVRALEIWKEEEKKFPSRVFHNTGVLWLCHGESNPIVDDSIPYAVKYNAGYERLNIDQLHQRYPMINPLGLSHAYFDPYGGYLKAREACQGVQGLFIREGGQFIQAHVAVRQPVQRHVSHLSLSNGTTINSDIFIFACGSWLPTMFGELSRYLNCTRQEVYYFGVPEKHSTIFDTMPVWIDLDGKDFYYGIPGNAQRGFKVGVDIRGPSFNPTSDDRVVDPIVLQRARTFLLNRFPLLRDAPLIESRVCPYENSSTGNFIFDLIPGTENAFVLGGGSGHGFKHGPALGELITSCLTASTTVPEIFRLH